MVHVNSVNHVKSVSHVNSVNHLHSNLEILTRGLGPERSRKYVFYSTVQIADPDTFKSK